MTDIFKGLKLWKLKIFLVFTCNLIILKTGLNFLSVLVKGDETIIIKVTIKYIHQTKDFLFILFGGSVKKY